MNNMRNIKISFCIVIALEEEFEYFLSCCPSEDYLDDGDDAYVVLKIQSKDGETRTGLVYCLFDQGPEVASRRTERLINKFKPELVISLGISGSIDGKVNLGDVVISSSVDNYSYRAKITDKSFSILKAIEWGGKEIPIDDRILADIKKIKVKKDKFTSDWKNAARIFLKSKLSDDVISELIAKKVLADDANYYFGPTASGPFLSASENFKKKISERNRNFLSIDMEAGAITNTVEEHPDITRVVVIRGISDPANKYKNELDEQFFGVFRSWAIHNASLLAMHYVRYLHDFGMVGYEKVEPKNDAVNKFKDAIETELVSKYIRHVVTSEDELLLMQTTIDSLYRHIITGIDTSKESILQALTEIVENSISETPFEICGLPGVGKSSLLRALYVYMLHEYKSGNILHYPIYINLHRYDKIIYTDGNDYKEQALSSFISDLQPLESLLASCPDGKIAVLLDGVDEFGKYDRHLEISLMNMLDGHSSHKKVIGIAETDRKKEERFKRNLSHLGSPEKNIKLSPISAKSEYVDDFIDAFIETSASQVDDKEDLKNYMLDKLSRFKMAHYDLFTLSVMLKSKSEHALQHAKTYSEFLKCYCETKLAKLGEKFNKTTTIDDAARLAYMHSIEKREFPESDLMKDARWLLVHKHTTIRDFLLAYHVIKTIRAVGRDSKESYDELRHVYPFNINRFCKEIMNLDYDSIGEAYDGAKTIYQSGESSHKPHMCYLMGRLGNEGLHRSAIKFLQSCRDEIDEKIEPMGNSADSMDLLLQRTIYISLIQLGDKKASEKYIERLIENPSANDLNRGFHRTYYGDNEYIPDQEMSNKDDIKKPFSMTCQFLIDKIASSLDMGVGYNLRDVEVFTLYSLAQHRHAKNLLDNDARQKLVEMLNRILHEATDLSNTTKDYCKMMERTLSVEGFTEWSIYDQLISLKKIKRRGWVDRGILDGESVADHCFGAYLIGLLFLPESDQDPAYSKQTILNILLTHDLAESKIGDLLPSERNEEKLKEEADEYSYYRMLGTYLGLSPINRIHSYWNTFDRALDINGMVAKDIDVLENLSQLHMYIKDGNDISGWEVWANELRDKVRTDHGVAILDLLSETYN